MGVRRQRAIHTSVPSLKCLRQFRRPRSCPSEPWDPSRTARPGSGAAARVPSADAGWGRVAPWASTGCSKRFAYGHGVPKSAEPRVQALGPPTGAVTYGVNH